MFNANAAWLVCAVMAFNLTRAAATLTKTAALARATTATIRRKLVTVPARIATSARRLHLHLPSRWPWQTAWSALYEARLHQTRRHRDLTNDARSCRAGTTVERPGRPATPSRPGATTATSPELTGHAPAPSVDRG